MIDSRPNPDPISPRMVLRFGSFTLDRNARLLQRDGQEVRLQPRVFDLLLALVARPGEVVTKDELATDVWRGRVVGDAALARAIMELRRALEDSATEPAYIETVSRVGVRFVAPVLREERGEPAEEAPPPDASLVMPEPAGAAQNASRRRATLGIAGGLVAMIGLGLGVWRMRATSIVLGILPIEPADSSAAGYASVLTEMVLGSASKLEGVVPRRVPSSRPSPREIARLSREYGLSRALATRLQVDGDRLSIAARLLDGEGRVVWAHETPALSEAGDLPASLARALAGAFERPPPHPYHPTSAQIAQLEAGRQYILGRNHLRERRQDLAQSAFEAALSSFPAHAPSHAGLALAIAMRGSTVDRPGNSLEDAEAHVSASQRLDPDLALGMAAAAFIVMRRESEPLAAIEARLTHALARDPTLNDARLWRATTRSSQGFIQEAVQDLEAAMVQDPTHPAVVGNLISQYATLGRLDEAEVLMQRASRVLADPQRLDLSRYMLATGAGKLATAADVILRYVERGNATPATWSMLASVMARLDAQEASRAALAQLRELGHRSTIGRSAGALMLLGDAHALDALLAQPILTSTGLDEIQRRELVELQGIAHAMASRWEQAIASLGPRFAGPGEVQGRDGDFMHPGSVAQWLVKALLESGQSERAHALLEAIATHLAVRATHGVVDQPFDTWLAARNAALEGRVEESFALLRKALDAGGPDAVTLRHDSRWDRLRGDPRFSELRDAALARVHRERERVGERALRAIRGAAS